jgi:tetratricopeptide (TPR) repeat protein
MRVLQSTINPRLMMFVAVLLTLLVYIPGLGGGYVFDDYNNILLNENIRSGTLSIDNLMQAGWSGMGGPLKRPLPMMSFAVNYATTGDFIPAFKLTNLVIHLINGLLIFAFLRLLTMSYAERDTRRHRGMMMLPAIAAAIWLLHPLNLTSVLYLVQRMNSLSALFTLAAMICFCVGRRRLQNEQKRAWWLIGAAVPGFIGLGILSKENALLAFPLIALVEICFYQLNTRYPRDRRILIGFFLVTLVLPAILVSLYVVSHPNFVLGGYAIRPFSLDERLLTESRVLWFYLSLLIVPRLNQFGLFHDDFELSSSLFEPVTTVVACAGMGLAIALAVLGIKRWPLLTFAVGWYLIGHVMESSVVALELVHEHRNYLPSVGVIFALCFAVFRLSEKLSDSRLASTFAVVVIGLCATVTFLRAGDWSDPATLAIVEGERHPNSFRAVYDLGRIQFGLFQLTQDEDLYQKGISNLERAAALNSSAKQPLIGLLRVEYDHQHEPKTEWMTELLYRYEYTLFHPSESTDLSRLVKCHAEKECTFPADDVAKLYHAALRNEHVPKYAKAQLMVDLAVFYVNQAGDLQPAMNLLDDAVALYPKEFNFRKVRAQIYLMAGQFSVVAEETRYMRSVAIWRDEIHSPDDAITALERGVAAASALDGKQL